MRELDRLLLGWQVEDDLASELPLPVAQDWDRLVEKSGTMAEVIDKHLNFESRLQGRELRPATLCPEQKVSLASDLAIV